MESLKDLSLDLYFSFFIQLFILYINDLPLTVEYCKTDMYADDSTFHLSGISVMDIQSKIQSNLNSIKRWCSVNKVYINKEKVKCMAVGTRQKLSCLEDGLSLQINSELLQTSECEKLLGVKVEPTLTQSAQTDQICSTISYPLHSH